MSVTLSFGADGAIAGSSEIVGLPKALSERLIFSTAPVGRRTAKNAGVSGTTSITIGISAAVTMAPNMNTARQSKATSSQPDAMNPPITAPSG